MTGSSAAKNNQLDFDFTAKVPRSSETSGGVISIASTGLPSFAYAQGARQAGRLNAATASDEEYKSLLKQRKELLDKKFSGNLTKREEHKLQYVRWSLDRIEDARHGHELDALEAAINQYEQFHDDLRALHAQLTNRK